MAGSPIFRDTGNFIRKLTLRKVVNLAGLIFSYLLSRISSKPFIWGNPVTLSVEPTNNCNLRCNECMTGTATLTRQAGFIDPGTFDTIIAEAGPYLASILLSFQGEPYLHPDFFVMIRKAHAAGLYVITSTNGHFLSEENARQTIESGLDRIIVSLDGMDQEVYSRYRIGGDIEKVKEGLGHLVQCKKQLGSSKPFIIIQSLVFAHNQHQLPEIRRWARQCGADKLVLKKAQILNTEKGSSLLPTQEYSRYIQDSRGSLVVKRKLRNRCWKIWSSAVVTWDGMVVPCCFDKDAGFVMGEIGNNMLRTIWQNGRYTGFRRKILTGRKNIAICSNCSEGLTVARSF